jgi:hypothetical protein
LCFLDFFLFPHNNDMAGDGASHEEIWDDSALLNSWDDALAEYKVGYASPIRDNAKYRTDNLKKYHSLAAKGETVDLSTLEEVQQANAPVDIQQKQQKQPPPNEAANATVEHSQTVAGANPTTQQPVVDAPATPVAATSAPASAAQPGAGAMPQALLNSGKQRCITCDCIEYGRLTVS